MGITAGDTGTTVMGSVAAFLVILAILPYKKRKKGKELESADLGKG